MESQREDFESFSWSTEDSEDTTVYYSAPDHTESVEDDDYSAEEFISLSGDQPSLPPLPPEVAALFNLADIQQQQQQHQQQPNGLTNRLIAGAAWIYETVAGMFL